MSKKYQVLTFSQLSPITKLSLKRNNKLQSACHIIKNKKKTCKFLGYFPLNKPFQAFYAYKIFKESYIKQVADEYKDLIYVTVYTDDIRAKEDWINEGLDESHIIPLKGNYWEIGEGPCGPDSEIFFDRGKKYDQNKIYE